MPDQAGDAPSLRTADWVASRLGISRWAVYELAKRRVLPCVRLGKLVKFDEVAVEAWIAAGGTRSPDDSPPLMPAPRPVR